MSKADLRGRIVEGRAEWDALVERAGDRTAEPGVAGAWTLRDVVAHLNGYQRFLVMNVGGDARPFETEQPPGTDPNDLEARNRWLHEESKHRTWTEVLDESRSLHAEILRQIDRRSDAELQEQMVPWAPQTIAEWLLDLTVGHWDEHRPDLEAWLAASTSGQRSASGSRNFSNCHHCSTS